MSPLDELVDRVKNASGINDPARLALAARVATDYAMLQSQALSGVIGRAALDHELGIVAATAANLDDTARQAVGAEIMAWTQGLLAKALGIALIA